MSIKFRTVDDLGVDASKQYALNQQDLDFNQLQDSRFVPQKTEISVTTPYTPSDYDSKFSIGRITIWASFKPPAGSATTAGRLFTYQLVPSLGGLDQQVSQLDHFAEIAPTDPTLKKEHTIIHNLLQQLVSIGQTFEQISARRSQYQKG